MSWPGGTSRPGARRRSVTFHGGPGSTAQTPAPVWGRHNPGWFLTALTGSPFGSQKRTCRRPGKPRVDLVQCFDEMIISYGQTRGLMQAENTKFKFLSRVDGLYHVLLLDGKLLGHWRAPSGTSTLEIRTEKVLDNRERASLDVAIQLYRQFAVWPRALPRSRRGSHGRLHVVCRGWRGSSGATKARLPRPAPAPSPDRSSGCGGTCTAGRELKHGDVGLGPIQAVVGLQVAGTPAALGGTAGNSQSRARALVGVGTPAQVGHVDHVFALGHHAL